jgi:hypothetical protein
VRQRCYERQVLYRATLGLCGKECGVMKLLTKLSAVPATLCKSLSMTKECPEEES